MQFQNPLLMRRLLGWMFVVLAFIGGFAAGLAFFVSWLAASIDPLGSAVMADCAKRAGIVSCTAACLAIYTFKGRIRIRRSA